jgi:hypothetical protein
MPHERVRLRSRRPNVTSTVVWPANGSNAIHVTLGFDDKGNVREVFARAKRPESEIDLVVDDAAVLISLALQFGATLGQVTHSLGRLPDGGPASVVALVADVALKTEAELRGPQLVK